MLEKYDAHLEINGNTWIKGKAHVLLPPCDTVAVVCSYTLSTCRKYYVGFVEGRFGTLMNARHPLAICWPGGPVRYVNVTAFSDRWASFKVPRADWLKDE